MLGRRIRLIDRADFDQRKVQHYATYFVSWIPSQASSMHLRSATASVALPHPTSDLY